MPVDKDCVKYKKIGNTDVPIYVPKIKEDKEFEATEGKQEAGKFGIKPKRRDD